MQTGLERKNWRDGFDYKCSQMIYSLNIIEKVKTAYKTINISNKSNANPSRLNIFKLECFFIKQYFLNKVIIIIGNIINIIIINKNNGKTGWSASANAANTSAVLSLYKKFVVTLITGIIKYKYARYTSHF